MPIITSRRTPRSPQVMGAMPPPPRPGPPRVLVITHPNDLLYVLDVPRPRWMWNVILPPNVFFLSASDGATLGDYVSINAAVSDQDYAEPHELDTLLTGAQVELLYANDQHSLTDSNLTVGLQPVDTAALASTSTVGLPVGELARLDTVPAVSAAIAVLDSTVTAEKAGTAASVGDSDAANFSQEGGTSIGLGAAEGALLTEEAAEQIGQVAAESVKQTDTATTAASVSANEGPRLGETAATAATGTAADCATFSQEGGTSIGLGLADSGTVGEAPVIAVAVSVADAGKQAEVQAVSAAVGVNEGPRLTELATTTATMSTADAACQAEMQLIGLNVQDAAATLDEANDSTVLIPPATKQVIDMFLLTEQASIAATLGTVDTGRLDTRTTVAAGVADSDSATQSEAAVLGIPAADTALADAQIVLAAQLSAADLLREVDAAAVQADVSATDAGALRTRVIVSVAVAAAETISQADTALVGLAGAESWAVADAASTAASVNANERGWLHSTASTTAAIIALDASLTEEDATPLVTLANPGVIVNLLFDYSPTIFLLWGQPVAIRQDFTLTLGGDYTLEFQAQTQPIGILNWSFSLNVKAIPGPYQNLQDLPALVEKTGDAFTILDPINGIFAVSLTSTDLATLGQGMFRYACWVTNANAENPLTWGDLTVVPSAGP